MFRQRIMHRFCEPFFHAIRDWLAYDDVLMLKNRIHVFAFLSSLLEKQFIYEIKLKLVPEHSDVQLQPAVVPGGGVEFTSGSDIASYDVCRNLVDNDVFHSAGFYFEKKFLRPLWDSQQSVDRSVIIRSIEMLFRLQKDSGYTRVVYEMNTDSGVLSGELLSENYVD